MKRQKRSSVHHLTRSMKKIGKSVGRANPGGIARHVMNHQRVRAAILKETGALLRREMKTLCRKDLPSLLRSKATNSFTWDHMVEELEERSPTLLQILKALCPG